MATRSIGCAMAGQAELALATTNYDILLLDPRPAPADSASNVLAQLAAGGPSAFRYW
jgi:hypothetical protein